MSHWWRAHDDAVDDPKLGLLSDRLHRCWFNLNCLASANNGALPPIGVVAFKLRIPEHKAAEIITSLVQARLIDRRDDGSFSPHNWNLRQFKSDVTDPTNAARQKRFRDRRAVTANTVTQTVTVTPPREQIADTDKKEPSLRSAPPPPLLLEAPSLGSSTSSLLRASANAVPWPADYRERFWELFPNKIGKASAIKKLEKIAKSDRVTFLDLMAALDRYVRKTDDRPWCNPETWINQERWTDEPAKANGHGKPDLAAMCFDLADELRARETAGPADRPIDLPGSHRNGR